MDKTVPSLDEPRLCPKCKRWIKYLKGQYLCTDCWLLFKPEETLEHPYKEELCAFVESKAEACIHYTCMKCTKSLMVSREDVEAHEAKMDLLFSQENVSKKRQEVLDLDKELEEQVRKLREKDMEAFNRWLKEQTESAVPGASSSG